jgi:hypothetical protein
VQIAHNIQVKQEITRTKERSIVDCLKRTAVANVIRFATCDPQGFVDALKRLAPYAGTDGSDQEAWVLDCILRHDKGIGRKGDQS